MEHALLKCDTTGPDDQEFCPDGYVIEVRRNDGKPLSEIELRSMLTQICWAVDGDKSMVEVKRSL